MDEWTQCQTCGLKYRARADGCPRCAKAAAEQPPPDLRDQIPQSPVYEPPRYEGGGGDARITEYSEGDAAEGPRPFRLPWYFLGGTVLLMTLGAIITPARPVLSTLMIAVGSLSILGAGIWALSVAAGLGVAWLIGSIFLPLVGLVALFRARNLRPLGLTASAYFMVVGGVMLSGGALSRGGNESSLTRAAFVTMCSRKSPPAECECQAAAVFEVLDASTRERLLENRETPADAARVKDAIRTACQGVW